MEEIPILRNYRVIPNQQLLVKGKYLDYIKDIRNVEKIRFNCAKSLMNKKWDLFFILFTGTDWIQHLIFDKLINLSDGKVVDEAIEYYKDIDRYIGWFLENIPKDTIIFVMSDHGFKSFNGSFFINEWLKNEGYLFLKYSSKTKVAPHKFSEGIEDARSSKRFNIPFFLLKILKKFEWALPVYRKIRPFLKFEIDLNYEPILEKSDAFCLSTESRGIYINDEKRFRDGKVTQAEYEKIRTELIKKLRHLEAPDKSVPLFRNIFKKEDIYSGNISNAPDIILELNNYIICSNFYMSIFENRKTIHTNNHDSDGIFMASGPGIKKGNEIKDAKIYDLAPTILHIFGLPIPNDMDGRVLTEIFEQDSELAKRKPVYVDPGYYEKKNEKEKLRSKIKKLKKQGN